MKDAKVFNKVHIKYKRTVTVYLLHYPSERPHLSTLKVKKLVGFSNKIKNFFPPYVCVCVWNS